MIQEDRLLELFFKLVRIPCPTRQERQAADEVSQKLKDLGFTVSEDQVAEKIGGTAGNIFAFLPGTVAAQTLMFSAHLDCVAPCVGIEPVLEEGVIRSQGKTILGSDDKAGVAAILEALQVVKEAGLPHGPIQVVFTVAEEGGLNGSKNLDPNWLKADLGYVFDSGGTPGEIVVEAPGQNHIEFVVHGKKAHAGMAPEEGINAITVAAQAIAALKQGRIDEETTANVGIIQGGIATNIVPDQVKVISEARSRNAEKLALQTQHMVETFRTAAEAANTSVDIEVSSVYESFQLKPDSPVVVLAQKAVQAAGLKPVLGKTGGGSDANYFNQYGLPAVVLGVGMRKAHTAEEHILKEDLINSAKLALALIQASLPKP